MPDPNRVAYLTQTTLSLDEAKDIIEALSRKFPNIKGPHAQDICYATENRQVAVKHVAADADLLLVVGSDNSSNSNRLVEVARNLGTESHLIDNCEDIQPEWLEGVKTIALTAGASAPECLVEEVVNSCGPKVSTIFRKSKSCRRMFASACRRRLWKQLRRCASASSGDAA